MEQLTPTFPNIVRSLDKLKILLFWEILKTKNPFLLDGDYMPDKKYTEEEESYIVQQWEVLYDNYFQLKNDGKSKVVLQKSYEVMILSYRIKNLNDTVTLLNWHVEIKDLLPPERQIEQEQQIYALFKKLEPDMNIQYFDTPQVNIEIVNKRIAALQNKHNRLKDDNEKKVAEQVDNVFSVIAKVSKITQMQLNAQNMVVTEWLAYEQMARETIKAEEEAKRKKKK